MLFHLLLIFQLIKSVRVHHFLGGSIKFSPSNDASSDNSTVRLTVVQTYLWTYSIQPCNTFSPSIKLSSSYQLACVPPCSTSINPKFISISRLSCIDANAGLGVSITQTVGSLRASQNSSFNYIFTNSAWRTFTTVTSASSAQWSLMLTITGLKRPDGTINSSPQVALVSPIVLVANNQPQIIELSVIDADFDIVQCRFANTTAECGTTCAFNSLPSNTTISSNCTLTIRHYQSDVWYAVSIQVEDFFPGNNKPLSSTPFQFLVNVRGSSGLKCGKPPALNSGMLRSSIYNVTINIPFSFGLTATTGCSNLNQVSVVDILSFALLNVVKGPLVRNRNSKVWTMNVTWTPNSQQVGFQLLCIVAIDRYAHINDIKSLQPNLK